MGFRVHLFSSCVFVVYLVFVCLFELRDYLWVFRDRFVALDLSFRAYISGWLLLVMLLRFFFYGCGIDLRVLAVRVCRRISNSLLRLYVHQRHMLQ